MYRKHRRLFECKQVHESLPIGRRRCDNNRNKTHFFAWVYKRYPAKNQPRRRCHHRVGHYQKQEISQRFWVHRFGIPFGKQIVLLEIRKATLNKNQTSPIQNLQVYQSRQIPQINQDLCQWNFRKSWGFQSQGITNSNKSIRKGGIGVSYRFQQGFGLKTNLCGCWRKGWIHLFTTGCNSA